MATFHIDDETADDGYLYVDVDDIATIIIRRWDDSVKVEICAHNHAGEDALAIIEAPDALLGLVRQHYQRKNRT